MTHNDLRNESEICDNLKSNAIKKNAKDISKYTRKATKEKDDNELNKIKDKETKKALEWLEVKWSSFAKILKQTNLKINWENVY